MTVSARTFFVILSLTFSCLKSYANQNYDSPCTEIDLRESKCLPPAKNQSDSEFCFAFAAAEALSFHFCKEVSAAALGISTFNKSPAKANALWPTKAGSWPEEAIQAGNESGFCLESEVPSQILKQNEAIALRSQYLELKEKIKQLGNRQPCERTVLEIQRVLPMIEIADVVSYIGSQHKSEDFLKFVMASCKNPIRQKVSVKTCEGDAIEKLKFIDSNIVTGPVPLGVKDGTGQQFKNTLGGFSNHHAVTIIGRKFENGSCQYLIRDSGRGTYNQGGFALGNENSLLDRWVNKDSLVEALSGDQSRCSSVY